MAPQRKALLERFLWKFKVDTRTGCWIWTGARAGADYSYLFDHEAKHPDGRTYNVYKYGHVAAYELFIGPIPEGKEIHHKCRVRLCVNPDHLDAITHRENMLLDDTIAARNASRTHCPRNHEYTPENTYLSKSGDRSCLACRKAYHPSPP